MVSSHVAREAYMYIALAFHYRPYTSGSKICFCMVAGERICHIGMLKGRKGGQASWPVVAWEAYMYIALGFHYRP